MGCDAELGRGKKGEDGGASGGGGTRVEEGVYAEVEKEGGSSVILHR